MSSSAIANTTFRPLNSHALHGILRVMTERFPAFSLPLLLPLLPDVLLFSPPEPMPVPDDAEPPPREDELPLEEPCPGDDWLAVP